MLGSRARALETRPSARSRPLAVAVLAAVAMVVFLVRLPAVVGNFEDRAAANSRTSSIGREIAGADLLAIDNDFLVNALTLLPAGVPYTVQMPASVEAAAQYNIVPTTFHALPGYVQFLLLPRRRVDAAHARYVLCYACNTDPFDKRGMKRLWSDPKGFVIGELPR